MSRYGISKLLLHFSVRHLAALAPPSKTGVILNVTDPGPCHSGLFRYTTEWKTKTILTVMYSLIARTAEQGSRALLHGFVAGENSHGKFLQHCKIDEYVQYCLHLMHLELVLEREEGFC